MGDSAGVSCALEGWGSNTGSPGSLRAAGWTSSMKRAVGALFALFAQQIDDNVRNGRGCVNKPVAVNPKRPVLTPFHTTSIFQEVEIP